MPTRVQLPDGSIGEFPDGMSQQDIEGVLQKQYGGPHTSRPTGLPAGTDLPGFPEPKKVNVAEAPSTAASRLLGSGNASDLGGVIGSHLKNIVAAPYHAFTDAPDAEEAKNMGTSTPGIVDKAALGVDRMLAQPTLKALGTAKKQFGAGNIGNPMGDYDAQGSYRPSAISSLMDAIPVAGGLARSVENDAHKSGALPALAGLGVDVGTPEAVGGVIGKIRDAAPSLAEGAMNIRPAARGYGKTPGRAILDETSGVRPGTIEKQGQVALNSLTPKVDSMAASYPGTIDITPARQVVADSIDTARSRNNASGRNALGPVADQLNTNLDNGLPLSANQTATGALNLKRGLRDAFVKSWSPDAASMLTRDTAKSASGALDSQLDNALGPEFAETNQRISSLIPVVENADKLTRADPLAQRLAGKLKAHTGALTSAIGGAAAGAHAGGGLGAILGGAAGFAIPEFIGSPATTMSMARAMNSPIPGTVIPPMFTGGILAPKEKK